MHFPLLLKAMGDPTNQPGLSLTGLPPCDCYTARSKETAFFSSESAKKRNFSRALRLNPFPGHPITPCRITVARGGVLKPNGSRRKTLNRFQGVFQAFAGFEKQIESLQ